MGGGGGEGVEGKTPERAAITFRVMQELVDFHFPKIGSSCHSEMSKCLPFYQLSNLSPFSVSFFLGKQKLRF